MSTLPEADPFSDTDSDAREEGDAELLEEVTGEIEALAEEVAVLPAAVFRPSLGWARSLGLGSDGTPRCVRACMRARARVRVRVHVRARARVH